MHVSFKYWTRVIKAFGKHLRKFARTKFRNTALNDA